MDAAGIRELKNNLSRYVDKVKNGRRIAITEHGKVVAELVPPSKAHRPTRYDALIASGVIRPARKKGDPLGGEEWPAVPLKSGTWLEELDESRKDFDEE